MNEMVFEGIQPLFDYLKSCENVNPQTHGMIGNFYQGMTVYTNPNTCGCKKGKKALDSLNAMYARIPTSLSAQNAAAVRSLFNNLPVVLKLDGAEVGRF
jgi:hypothetical protein